MIQLPWPPVFDWDEGNRDKSRRDHGISWEETEEVFWDPSVLLIQDSANSNRHRANVLNSFAFLYSTVGTEVPAVREQLTVLVATAVYQSFETGFLTDKTTEIGVLPLEILSRLKKD